MNIRHDLDPIIVSDNVDRAVSEHDRRRGELKASAEEAVASYQRALEDGTAKHWARAPSGPGYIDPMIDEWIAREKNYYAKVRVIEREDGFRLVYGDVDDATVQDGTGPFKSFNKAVSWFTNGGR